MKYEREVQEYLALYTLGNAELEYHDGPWMEYQDESGKRWCQPDALLINSRKKHCVIIEVKYQHTSDAWWQLRHLYLPVLQVALRGFTFRLLEMVHWYDPSTVWPERALNVRELGQLLTASPSGETVATLIFNKRRELRLQQSRHSGGASSGDTARPLWPASGTE